MKQFWVLTVIFIIVFSCKKNNIPNRPVDADLKAAFSYKPGTYWIYKDSLSGEVDSFFVRQISYGNDNGPNSLYTYDAIAVFTTEWNILNKADSNLWEIGMSTNQLTLSYDNSAIYLYLINYNPPLIFPFNNTLNGNTVTGVNELTIGGNIFNDVYQVHYTDISINLNDYYYINSDVGVVKIILNHPYDTINRPYDPTKRIWEIQRWKIVK